MSVCLISMYELAYCFFYSYQGIVSCHRARKSFHYFFTRVSLQIRLSKMLAETNILQLQGTLTAGKLCTSQFPNHPSCPPPRGIWLALSSVQWGVWPKMRLKRLSAVGSKRILQFFDSAREPRSRVIALVDSTWVFLLLSFCIVILWNMPLFKVWSEDKLNKKFVVAENFAELVVTICLLIG